MNNHDTEEDYKNSKIRYENQQDKLNVIYNDIQTPILIVVIFFIFNLPITKGVLYKLFKFMFHKDGNYNMTGISSVSLIFGLVYYILDKGLNYLSEVKEKNEQIVFISGHFNNFELMAMEIEKAGINLCTIYRPLNNPFLNILMERLRKNYICKNQIKKG